MVNEVLVKDDIKVENMIYEVRGKYVMLDSDLGRIYECKNGTKTINQAVNRHLDRFPNDFYFQLTEEECKSISRFQIETLNGRGHNIKYFPYAFTEQGIAMLATVLRTSVAEEMSIKIMDAFVKMRHYLNYNKILLPNKILLLEDKVDNNTKRINELFDKFDCKDIAKNFIFYQGDFYDSYSVVMDIFNESKKEIIIIDNYAGKELLDILKNIDKNIIILSKNIDEILKKKYESQYSNVTYKNNETFHDRFVLIDRCKLYSCGASFKDLGKKCFAINEIKTKEIINIFVSKLEIILK